ncbi:MAG: menaquinone biosynthesis protein [Gemmatimonadetes bacterium]|jgi:chorismate dehydratase|nr:menaquinone biosynthesis protein [Gemmatimonadota bacterium]MBT5054967.1 menaquinone biosynthesis protein [Gemmatimonadota bacterium]MBT5145036.1 menaquinone biosynthesis protein [Gemmatimonadota bacterium]MBT5592115.1 menaquinone biosynthesis protein [Gemmatimonadota bacterium]MBT5964172.1 menaquinone biosynthesis protein [Gemmatimonadota bacterium]
MSASGDPDCSSSQVLTPKIRLGAVSYLNTRSLTVGLDGADSPFELHHDLPARCAADLEAGSIDVGLIPVIEYARQDPHYWIVPGISIASQGEVLTVRLFYRGELAKIKRIAVDTSSRTSVALMTVLLREQFGLDPEHVAAAPDLDAMLHHADAALLIGDPVLPLVAEDAAVDNADPRQSLDLGKQWTMMTGKPFVFAFWAGRQGAIGPGHVARLQQARLAGSACLPQIAATFQRERAGDAALYERYLRDHIRHDLGAEELDGLREFYRLAAVHGVIDAEPGLRFYPAGSHRSGSDTSGSASNGTDQA